MKYRLVETVNREYAIQKHVYKDTWETIRVYYSLGLAKNKFEEYKDIFLMIGDIKLIIDEFEY